MCPIIVRCKNCGFVLGMSNFVTSVNDILKKYDYRCPCCLSRLDSPPTEWEFTIRDTGRKVINPRDPREIYQLDKLARIVVDEALKIIDEKIEEKCLEDEENCIKVYVKELLDESMRRTNVMLNLTNMMIIKLKAVLLDLLRSKYEVQVRKDSRSYFIICKPMKFDLNSES